MTSNFDIIQPVRVLLTFFRFIGLWHHEGTRPFLRFVHSASIQIPFVLAFVMFMYVNQTHFEDVESQAESFYLALTETAMLVKLCNLIFKHKTIKNLLKMMQVSSLQPKNAKERKIYETASKKYSTQRTAYLLLCVICVFSGCIKPIFSSDAKLPFPVWLPFDWKRSAQYYWCAWAYVSVAASCTGLLNTSLDLFQTYFMFQIATYFQVLSVRLESVGYNDGRQNKKASLVELVKCIKVHQHITRMATVTEAFVTIPLFCQINISAIVLCFTAFQLTLLSPLQDTIPFLTYFYFMSAWVVQILLPCYYANDLTVQSEFILIATYNSNWTHEFAAYRRLMLTFMERAKQPTTIRAGGYFILGLDLMLSVMRSAYSFFALLIRLTD